MKLIWGGLYWMRHGRPKHGPQVWPWWKLATFNVVELRCYDGSHFGWRLWCYTKWGSQHFDYLGTEDLAYQHRLDSDDNFRRAVFEGRAGRVDTYSLVLR